MGSCGGRDSSLSAPEPYEFSATRTAVAVIFAILTICLLVLGVILAVKPLRRSVVCPQCKTRNSSAALQCPNCQRVGLKGKVSAGGIGPAEVVWTCPACKTVIGNITCKRCGTSLQNRFTT